MKEWMSGWDRAVVKPAGSPVEYLRGEELQKLVTQPQLTLLG